MSLGYTAWYRLVTMWCHWVTVWCHWVTVVTVQCGGVITLQPSYYCAVNRAAIRASGAIIVSRKKRDELSSCVLVGAPSLLVRVHMSCIAAWWR